MPVRRGNRRPVHPSSSGAIASIRRADRASFVLPAAIRNSAAVSSRRVIAIRAMPASCLSGRSESDFARLGNSKRVSFEGRWYEYALVPEKVGPQSRSLRHLLLENT